MGSLRLELFVAALEPSIDFYQRVLGFTLIERRPDGYTVMEREGATIDLQPVGFLEDGHPAKPRSGFPNGLGIEIVIEVDNVDDAYKRVVNSEYRINMPLGRRFWGLRDFRLVDPDGRYIRITARTIE